MPIESCIHPAFLSSRPLDSCCTCNLSEKPYRYNHRWIFSKSRTVGEGTWRETASTGAWSIPAVPSAIAQHEPERILYLAIPVDAYEQIFLGPMAQQITSQYDVHVLVFDPIGEEVRIWGD